MVDREKVIKGLEETEILLIQAVDRGGEMAVMGAFKCLNRVTEALAMLKEQEAVEPRVSSVEQRCGNCNKVIEMDGWQFCPWCGKRIDWKGWWKKNGTRNQDS